MQGFFLDLTNNKSFKYPKVKKENKIFNEIYIDGNYFFRNTIDKFLNDKVLHNSDSYFFVIEGVIVNSNELIDKYNMNSWEKTILKMFRENGETFFNEFRGSFSGMFWDKKADLVYVYTDHINDKSVFYIVDNDLRIFCTDYNYLYEFLTLNQISLSFSSMAAYSLVAYGFMIEDLTLINEIKRLIAGKYIRISKQGIEINQYHRFSTKEISNKSETEIIEDIDRLFRQAIRRAFEKDNEYGYGHVITLSGGLDSRMTNWVAWDMGYCPALNLTFSKKGYLEETIPNEIAQRIGNQFHFTALEGDSLFRNIDNVTMKSAGQIPCSHLKAYVHSRLDLNGYGLIHTGHSGDAILATKLDKKECDYVTGALSSQYSYEIRNKIIFNELYQDNEMFFFYNRVFRFTNEGLRIYQNVSETYSPFTDVDFFEYAMSLPRSMRLNHSVYLKWVMKKYPESAEYIWESKRMSVRDWICYNEIKDNPKHAEEAKRLFDKRVENKSPYFSMFPLELWYKNNYQGLKRIYDNYFYSYIYALDSYPDLRQFCEKIYFHNNASMKAHVLTLLSNMHCYFNFRKRNKRYRYMGDSFKTRMKSMIRKSFGINSLNKIRRIYEFIWKGKR